MRPNPDPAGAAPNGTVRPQPFRARWLTRIDARLLSRLVLLLLAGLVVATFRDYGISWDENVQNTYGRDLLAYYLSGFRDQSAFHFNNLRYYGGAFDLIAAILNTVSPFGEYETRHLLGGAIGVLGAIGAWRLARLLAGERAGFFAVALTALTPLLYGHSFFNPKDAPLACALLWTMYYACRVITEAPRPTRATAVGLGVAFGTAFGTRVIAGIVILYCIPPLIAYAWGRYRDAHDGRAVARELATFLVPLWPAVPIASALTALFWPWVVQAPGNLEAVLMLFSHFQWDGPVLFDGVLYPSNDLPAAYLPKLIALQLPELVLFGLLAAIASGIRAAPRLGRRSLTDPRVLCYSVVLAAVLVPLLHFVIARPLAHNGIRHYLFMIPPLIVLAGIGLERAYAWALSRGAWAGRGFAAAFAVAASIQIAVMVGLHPDEYVYYNAFAGGVRGAQQRYELDYWGVSLAEATRDLERIVAHEKAKPDDRLWGVYVCGDPTSATYYFRPDGRLRYEEDASKADFAVALDQCATYVRGRRLAEVKRGGAVLSYVTDLRDQASPSPGAALPSAKNAVMARP